MKAIIRILACLLALNVSALHADEAFFLLDTGHGGQPGRALLLETEVDLEITGLLARAEVRQRFSNDSGEWAEGRYVFPLPDDAAVDALTIRAGGRLIVGEIQERGQARETYRQARESGRRAGLVEQERPNLFTTSVANIGPGEEVEVIIGFDAPVKFEEGRFSLRFPTSIAPRYAPGAPLPQDASSGTGLSPDTDRVPDASRVTPPLNHPGAGPADLLTLSAVLRPGIELSSVTSSHHPVKVERTGDEWFVYLLEAADDRDLELIWTPARPDQAHTAVFTEHFAGEDYAMVMLLPPHKIDHAPPPREVILIIDTSGSMRGEPIGQAREALKFALDTLEPHDRFNVIEFNSITRGLFDSPVAATQDRVLEARRFVDGLDSGGGTEMGPSLEMAAAGTPPQGYLRQIVFITDGAVANEAEVLEQIRFGIGESRLFNVGIGHGVNEHFLRTGARHGRGSYTFIADNAQIVDRMSELVTRLESPAIQHIELDWPRGTEMYPEKIPDLYVGEPLMVMARVEQSGGTLVAGGWQGERVWQQDLSLDLFDHAPGVARLWARKRIEALQDPSITGADAEAAREDILDTALRFQLLSPYTALVAVDRTPVRPAGASLNGQNVPANLPAGRDMHAWPATAAGKLEKVTRGAVALMLLLLLLFGRWTERNELELGR